MEIREEIREKLIELIGFKLDLVGNYIHSLIG